VASPPRVGLFGLLGQGNLGNDGSMEAVLGYLRTAHPEAALDALCSDPDALTARYGIPAQNLRSFVPSRGAASGPRALAGRAFGLGLGAAVDAWRIPAWVRRHDAVIVPGMGVLETTVPIRPWKTPYWMFLLCASGRILGTRVALASVGANVTRHRATRWLIAAAARLAHYRSFRDQLSRDALRQMGVNTAGDAVSPDVAFALPAPAGVDCVPGSVGLGVMDYSGDNDETAEADQLRANYLAQLKKFTRWLIDSGHPVRLFSSDTVDQPVIAEIAADVLAHRPELDRALLTADPAETVAEVMRQIASVETVVATRYHNVLYALLQAKPALALAYGAKHEQLVADAGLPDCFLPCRSLSAADMIEKFTAVERDAALLRRTLAERNAVRAGLVQRQLATMCAAIMPALRLLSAEGAEDVGVGAGGHERVLHPGDLVDRRPAHLPDGLGDEVHPVQVSLADQPAVGVDGEAPAAGDVAVGDEVPRLARLTEPERLEPAEDARREGVVDHGDLDVLALELRLGEEAVGRAVIAGSLHGAEHHRRRLAKIPRPFGRGQHQCHPAVALLAAVEQPGDRLHDPP
jgi:polysaccharide pyruvyl transferase WcaK-like protein